MVHGQRTFWPFGLAADTLVILFSSLHIRSTAKSQTGRYRLLERVLVLDEM